MSYEAFRYIFIIGLVLCCVMFLVSVVLFFVLNIPKIISDLSGRTARKAIQDIRKQNEDTGHKSYQVSQVNRERGKLTDKISPSGRIVSKNPSSQLGYSVETAKIAGITEETSLIANANETSVLSPDGIVLTGQNETTVLSQNEAVPVVQNETTVLSQDGAVDLYPTATVPATAGETEILSDAVPVTEPVADNNQSFSGFRVEFEITYIHTNEVIDIGGAL